MREIINVHIGNAGIKVGEALWELLCLEHGVCSDGTLSSKTDDLEHTDATCNFYEANQKLFPRALFLDSEPDAIDGLRRSSNGQLFNPAFLISGAESAANCFARGRHYTGPQVLEDALHQIRRMVERCDSFQGFFFFRSICGGTGSGVAALLTEYLSSEFQRKNFFELAILPSPSISAIPVEPYNAVLSTQAALPTMDCSFVVDNEAVYKLLEANLKPTDAANDRNLNLLIAQALSTATLGFRSTGVQAMSMAGLVTALVPFKRLHYSGLSFAQAVKSSTNHLISMEDMTRDLFENRAGLISCDFNGGRHIARCLLYRGSLQPLELQQTIVKLRSLKDVTKAPWCSPVFRLSHVSCPTVYPKDCGFYGTSAAVSMLTTNTAIKNVFAQMARKFSVMASKKAFLHTFNSEGMRVEDIMEAFEDVKDLIGEYQKQEEDASDESFSSNTDGM